MKLQAGAIQYTVMIGLVVAIIMSSIILLAFYNRISFENYIGYIRQVSINKSAFELALSNEFLNGESNSSLFNEGNDSMAFRKSYWGAYEVIGVQNLSTHYELKQSGLIGTKGQELNGIAIAVQSSKAIVVCGDTRIVGDLLMKNPKVEKKNIEGKHYKGGKLVFGNVRGIKSHHIPAINNELIRFTKTLLKGNFAFPTKNADVLVGSDSLHNEFHASTLVFKSNNQSSLGNSELSGNILVWSSEGIIIGNRSQLNNVFVVAPYVKIEQGFEGQIHIVAKDSLIIGEDVHLGFPSSVMVVGDEQTRLLIGEHSTIEGTVFNYSETTLPIKPYTEINKNSLLEGLMCTNGIIQLKGSIMGTLVCDGFYLKTTSGIYENYLLDCEVNKPKSNEHVLWGSILDFKGEKEVVVWL